MVVVSPPIPALSADTLSLFYAADELLAESRLLVFYGPSATTSAAANNSRIQAHIFSPTGLQSYPRLTISPSSPLYAAVECLPREEQGDEICRGLAFTLFKYFSELPAGVKDAWTKQYAASAASLPSAPRLFSEAHAAMVSSRMLPVTNADEVLADLKHAFSEQTLSWVDIDVILPPKSMRELDRVRESIQFDDGEDEVATLRYGDFAPIVRLFGELDFLPTSRLKRAPSKPTAINRNLAFPKKQKENLRREMCELLDTEESYVSKLHDLVHSVAADFREKASVTSAGNSSPSKQALEGLFPPCLDSILKTNTGFLDAIRTVLEDTENDAINDIETTVDDGVPYVQARNAAMEDVTGALALANCLLAWFPQFSECYPDYMQAHCEFSGLLRDFMKDTGSSFSKRIHDTGEQRLMSMLIEPVQRLPRYNLYIDNIVKQLPLRHPALKPLLKARDTISEICSRDTPASHPSKVVETLRRIVPSWPSSIRPEGRLVTAVDVIELAPPFRSVAEEDGSRPGIMLLFTDCLILLRKPPSCAQFARSLLATIDKAGQSNTESDQASDSSKLEFHHRVMLNATQLCEMGGGTKFQLTNLTAQTLDSRDGSRRGGIRSIPRACPRVFQLAGSYEDKAGRFIEEVTRASVEGRFPDMERESHKWEVRASTGGDLSLFSAIFEDDRGKLASSRGQPANIRIMVDPVEESRVTRVGQDGIDIVATLDIMDDDFYRLEIDSFNDYGSRDHLTSSELLPVLKKRLGNLLVMRHHLRNPTVTAVLLLRYQQILKSLTIWSGDQSQASSEKVFRPASPVKKLTNLFGGAGKTSISKRAQKALPGLAEIPRMMSSPSKPPSREGEKLRSREDVSTKSTIGMNGEDTAGDVHSRMDETLASYILALHARKGNVVGRVLRARANASELAINELYNSLIEDPMNPQLAAQSPVDVLFSAFEKFIKVAWKDSMGDVVPAPVMSAIQAKSDTASQGEFEDFFRARFAELGPQNQRALRAIIRLLADLLDGTSSDSDRGTLTASFAQVLVSKGNSNTFISLLDRFVEDIVALFGRPGSSGQSSFTQGSMTSDGRSTATLASSLSSNPSSLRKKFGLSSLSRENSARSETESKVSSVWRSMSRSGRGGADKDNQGSTNLKPGSLVRSKSTDVDNFVPPKRGGRERPAIHGAFNFEPSPKSGRQGLVGGHLDPIGEVPHAKGPPRKKRRSSLSDLHTLRADDDRDGQGSLTPRTPGTPTTPRTHSRQASASPRSSYIYKQPGWQSPSRGSRPASPTRQANAAPSGLPRPQYTVNTPSPARVEAGVTITTYSPQKRQNDGNSNIPTLSRGNSAPTNALTERPGGGNSTRKPVPISKTDPKTGAVFGPSPPKRLRMQSPQKLRERLNAESKALREAESALQAELAKIGEEMSKLSGSPTATNRAGRAAEASSIAALEARVKALETSMPSTLADLTSRTKGLGQDIQSSLQVSEARCRKLDELYREANAENEALYLKFNEELAKAMKCAKVGSGEMGVVEDARRRLGESAEEVARLKKENGRLKRENVGLRAQVRD